jgi:CDP-diacylglycerol--glycerol-3-phosphate 3-phosphatidyltransferase
MPLTLANKITLGRMLFIPLFILLILYYNKSVALGAAEINLRWFATAVFLGIFLLDAVDGYIARSRNEISKLGTLLDPLADKAMLLSALIILGHPSLAFETNLPMWFVLLVISRDVMLIGGALIIQSIVGHVTVRPRISGKATTFFQMAVIIWVLIGLSGKIFFGLVYTAAALTFLSALQYVFDGIRQLEKVK